jgi:hypothetical protein
MSHLLAHGWHRVPRIENVRDAVPRETGEVFRLQPVLVPKLHTVRPARRQSAETSVQISGELCPMFMITRIKTRELKHEDADIRADLPLPVSSSLGQKAQQLLTDALSGARNRTVQVFEPVAAFEN